MHVAFIDSLCKCIPCTLFPSQSPSHPAGRPPGLQTQLWPSWGNAPHDLQRQLQQPNTRQCSCSDTSPECQQSHYSSGSLVVVCPIQEASLEIPLWWTCPRAIVSDGTAHRSHQPIVGVRGGVALPDAHGQNIECECVACMSCDRGGIASNCVSPSPLIVCPPVISSSNSPNSPTSSPVKVLIKNSTLPGAILWHPPM